jgi:SAM-dependent methyltransferase
MTRARCLKVTTANTLENKGVAGAVQQVLARSKSILVHYWKLYAVWSPWNPWYRYLDERFDRRFAVDTAGVLILPEIHSDPRFNGYSPTPHSFFLRMLRHINVDHAEYTFIDFGCGKGKALLLAAQLSFKRIIGIELSSELIRIAADNLSSYRGKRICKTIDLEHTDARNFHIPNERTIFYFCDPFEAELMRTVVGNIRSSLVSAPREIYILYFMPVHRGLLDEAGFLTLVRQASWYCIYKASGGVGPLP